MENYDSKSIKEQMNRIEELVRMLEQGSDSAVRVTAGELVQTVLDLHGHALYRILEMTCDEAGQDFIDALVEDELVGSVLLLHGLHPLPLETRILRALDHVRPYLESHGGNVELLGVSPAGEVLLRLEGSCQGCSASQLTLQHTIEEAIYEAAPDVTSIHVDGNEPEFAATLPDDFIPIDLLPPGHR